MPFGDFSAGPGNDRAAPVREFEGLAPQAIRRRRAAVSDGKPAPFFFSEYREEERARDRQWRIELLAIQRGVNQQRDIENGSLGILLTPVRAGPTGETRQAA